MIKVARITAALALTVIPSWASACNSIPRITLALYDGAREAPRDTRIHRYVEMVLNHLGQRVVYHDISTPDPVGVEAGSIAMVLSWLDEAPAEPVGFWEWIGAQDDFCDGMPKIVSLGEPAINSETGSEVIAMVERAIGIQRDGSTYALGMGTEITEKDNGLFDFEADFLLRPGDYSGIHARPDGQSLLRVAKGNAELDLATFGEAGAYLHGDAAVAEDGRGESFWIVDPFAFFGRILGTPVQPVPDSTTLDGRRIFFATIGGDGWLDVMPARSFDDAEELASEVLVERLVEPYPDLPFTVAPLTGDLDAALGGKAAEPGRQAAIRALSRPNVEIGTQGYSGIWNWDFFASYDEGREAEILQQPQRAGQRGALVASAVQTLGDTFVDTGTPTSSRAPDAPRKYAGTSFDLGREVTGPLAEVAALGGRAGAPEVFVWAGNARPFEAALAAAGDAGVEAIGGGGGVAYPGAPSLTNLWPLAAPVGEHLQIYDALSGDAAYTGGWAGPLYGFYGLEDTLRRTEEPRRLKPFQLSFDARSAVFFDTRRAAARYLEEARTADVIPIHAGRYARMIRGFETMRVTAEGENAWRIDGRGGLQTVRFDGVADRALDLARSSGVLGARRKGDSLYVALDPETESPLVALAGGDEATGMKLDRAAPVLESSRVEITSLRRAECSAELRARGVAGGVLGLVGTPGASYRVVAAGAEPETVTTDDDGRMSVFMPIDARGIGGASILGACEDAK